MEAILRVQDFRQKQTVMGQAVHPSVSIFRDRAMRCQLDSKPGPQTERGGQTGDCGCNGDLPINTRTRAQNGKIRTKWHLSALLMAHYGRMMF
jgi:hypothetical protein